MTIGTKSSRHITAIKHAVSIAVFAFVRNPGAIEVSATAGRNVTAVDHVVPVTVAANQLTHIRNAIGVAVEFTAKQLTLVGGAVLLAVRARSVGNIDAVKYAVAIAVFALVRNTVGIAVGTRAIGNVAYVQDGVSIAITGRRQCHATNNPLSWEE